MSNKQDHVRNVLTTTVNTLPYGEGVRAKEMEIANNIADQIGADDTPEECVSRIRAFVAQTVNVAQRSAEEANRFADPRAKRTELMAQASSDFTALMAA